MGKERPKHVLRIAEIAKEKGMTLADLCFILGIHRNSLQFVMVGNPTLKRINEVAEALGVHPRELFYD